MRLDSTDFLAPAARIVTTTSVPSPRCREHHTMFAHVFDAREHVVSAFLQIVAYEVDRLHLMSSKSG
jgi:hypothetical protein